MTRTWMGLLGVWLLAGCASLEDTRSQQAMAGREEILLLQEDFRRLAGRLEGVEMEITRLQANLETLRAEQQRLSQSQAQNLQTRVDELDGRLRNLDAARERDKQELIENLSKKIAQLVGPPAAGGARKSGTAKRQGASTGYEHEVKPGETLSAIAAVYGVSTKVIMEDNELQDADRLRVGQKLFIRD